MMKTIEKQAVNTWSSKAFWVLGQRVTVLADSRSTGGEFSLVEIIAPVNCPSPPLHSHDNGNESFHIMEGEIELFLNGEWHRVETGTSCVVQAGQPHTFRNAGETPARLLSVFTPGGFDQFFSDIGIPAEEFDEAPAITPEVANRVMSTAHQYGMSLHL